MPTIGDIPDEILEQFFEESHSFEYERPENPTPLPSVALVCRRWRAPAQCVLFRHLTFDSQWQASRWLASPARTDQRVKSVHIGWVEKEKDPLGLGGGWGAALEACAGVTSLELRRDAVPYDVLLIPSLSDMSSISTLSESR